MRFLISIKIYGISKKDISKLQGESLKKYSHNIKKMIGRLILQEDNDNLSKLPNNVKKKIYKEMRYYFYPPHLKEQMSLEELIERSKRSHHEFYTFDNKSEFSIEQMDSIILKKVEEFEKTISDSSVNDAFPRGRYGHLDGYIPNLDALFYLVQGLRKSVKLLYKNAITVADGLEIISRNYCTDIRYIFPDKDSKIYVVDGNTKELTRIYSLEFFPEESIFLTSEGELEEEEYLVVSELGQNFIIEKFREGSQVPADDTKTVEFEKELALEPSRSIPIYKDLKETKIIFTTNGKKEILLYCNGKLISEDPSREPWIEEAIELYENKNVSHKKITSFEAIQNALTKGITINKANEANSVEQLELNPENIKEGETKDD